MRRAALLLIVVTPLVQAAEHRVDTLAEMQVDVIDAPVSWRDRGPGRLNDGSADDTTETAARFRLALEYHGQFTETLGGVAIADAWSGEQPSAGITEGWLTWSPVPVSPWQYRVRAGGFIPPFSLEHTATAWTSTWMPTASVLNSWIGEELHVTGAEFTARHLGAMTRSKHTLTFRAGVFMGNDTSGTVLSWRGFAPNDRVTPRNDYLVLPDRAVFRPGGTFPGDKESDPFVDLDGRPGYYLTGEWRYADHLRFLLGHYDNRADPLAFANGQAGWLTRFQLIGVHYKPQADVDVLAQAAAGNTFVGRRGSVFSVDNDFSSAWLLVSRDIDALRLSARAEIFEVTDEDPNLLDDNRENGNAFAIAFQYTFSPWKRGRLVGGIEFLQIESERPEWALIGLPIENREQQLRFMLRAFF